MRINGSINMNEGQIRQICAYVDCDNCDEMLRERPIPISLSLMLSNASSSKDDKLV